MIQAYTVESMRKNELTEVVNLLNDYNLSLEDTVNYTAVIKDKSSIIGTCSFEKNILKSFMIKKCYQGTGAASRLLTHMINKLFDLGEYTVLAYTASSNRTLFEEMQFKCIYDTGSITLMLSGLDSLNQYIQEQVTVLGSSSNTRSAIVMNGNPFTKGHKHLIKTASEACDEVILFVVEEECSTFSFKSRFGLIKKGAEEFKNVKVIRGGPFIVSLATFPNYFLRDDSLRAVQSAELDANIFASIIANKLNITSRYVGTEPYCKMTAMYNDVMKLILNKYGIEVKVVKRLEDSNKAISASDVRTLLVNENWQAIKKIVPKDTYTYLKSEDGNKILKSLKEKVNLH